MKRLGGWQRLWVVLSVMMAIVASIVVVALVPRHVEHDDTFYERLTPEAKAQLATMKAISSKPSAFDPSTARPVESGPWDEYAPSKVPETSAVGNTDYASELFNPRSKRSAENDSRREVDANPGAFTVRMPNGHLLPLRPGIRPDRSTPVLKEYNEIIESELILEQSKFIGVSILCWAVASLGLYVIGWSLGWIYRGFKNGG